MAMKKCKECGKEVSSSAKVCPHCGKKLKMGFFMKLLIGVGVLIVLGAIGSQMGDGESSSSSTSAGGMEPSKKAEVINAKIGDDVSVGNFVYRVENISFRKSIGNEFMRETADGIYLLVNLTLKNVDKEAHTVDNSLFQLTDASGTEYESSTGGSTAMEMSGGKTLFLKQCQPNIQTSGYLVFEVPQKGSYHLKVSGGFWSGKTGDILLEQS